MAVGAVGIVRLLLTCGDLRLREMHGVLFYTGTFKCVWSFSELLCIVLLQQHACLPSPLPWKAYSCCSTALSLLMPNDFYA